MDDCEWCHITYGAYYGAYKSQKLLAIGGWTSLFIAKDAGGQIVLRAHGDDYTDDCRISYCPFCGRKLDEEGQEK